jgi:hypothetical protein
MGRESEQKASESDGTGATLDSVTATRREKLNKRLQLTPEQIEALEELTEPQRDLWYQVVEGWFAPEEWLAAVDAELQKDRPVAAFHVPSAEGVATYRGLFGGNGSLSEPDKEIVINLLQRAIGGLPEDDGNSSGGESDSKTECGKARSNR